MGELPKDSCNHELGEVGDNLINTDITAIFREARTRKMAVTNKSTSVDYLPSGLVKLDLDSWIPGSFAPSVEQRSQSDGDKIKDMRIPGECENRRGSLSLHESRVPASGRSRTNTMPNLSPPEKIQTSQNNKLAKEEKEAKPPVYQSSQSMVETRESVTIKTPDFQSSQSMVETKESITETESNNRKLSEVLMSSWFFQRNSSDSETDLNSLSEETTLEEEVSLRKTIVPAKNNENHHHSDNENTKKISFSHLVAGNFSARDLRSLNAFVPQST